jgi:hypothetical protein
MKQFDTPILFLVFNRPDTTQLVFDKIKEIQPKKLFIAYDGPRTWKEGEEEKTKLVRKICSDIDWNCEVQHLYRDTNLGCGKAVSEAITWFFENVEEGIILEDDCLPNKSFFDFCDLMLSKFRHDPRILHISGNNFQFSKIGTECFYLTKIPHIWGWATWKRAWKNYDYTLSHFNETLATPYFDIQEIDNYWHSIFIEVKKLSHTWDYQWVYSIFRKQGLCVAPQYNLVSNIGFRADGTHTMNETDFLSTLKTYDLEIPPIIGNCTYDVIHDINEQVFFKWTAPILLKAPLSMAQLIREIAAKFSRRINLFTQKEK